MHRISPKRKKKEIGTQAMSAEEREGEQESIDGLSESIPAAGPVEDIDKQAETLEVGIDAFPEQTENFMASDGNDIKEDTFDATSLSVEATLEGAPEKTRSGETDAVFDDEEFGDFEDFGDFETAQEAPVAATEKLQVTDEMIHIFMAKLKADLPLHEGAGEEEKRKHKSLFDVVFEMSSETGERCSRCTAPIPFAESMRCILCGEKSAKTEVQTPNLQEKLDSFLGQFIDESKLVPFESKLAEVLSDPEKVQEGACMLLGREFEPREDDGKKSERRTSNSHVSVQTLEVLDGKEDGKLERTESLVFDEEKAQEASFNPERASPDSLRSATDTQSEEDAGDSLAEENIDGDENGNEQENAEVIVTSTEALGDSDAADLLGLDDLSDAQQQKQQHEDDREEDPSITANIELLHL